jgi:hypothetical protein
MTQFLNKRMNIQGVLQTMFYPGGGRPKGSLNTKTLQVQAFCRSICEDPEYRASILQRARSNQLGSMESVVWAYGYGKPKESVDLRVGRLEEDLSSLSTTELMDRAASLSRELRDAHEIELVLQASDEPDPKPLRQSPGARTIDIAPLEARNENGEGG